MENVLRWKSIIIEVSKELDLDPLLVAAMVHTESSGNPFAIRVEPAWWRRYGARAKEFARNSTSKHDSKWIQFPDVYAASYGLMQVMYQTCRETGFDPAFPTEMCDAGYGLRVGCVYLKRLIQKAGGNTRAALLRYNGGADKKYPDRVMSAREQIARRW